MPTPTPTHTMPIPEAAAAPRPTVLTEGKLREMYVALVECQMLAQSDLAVSKNGQAEVAAGMEAILAGCTAAMEPTDQVILPRWIPAAGHLRGVPLTDSLEQLKASGNGTRSSGDDAAALIIELAVGLACGAQMQRSQRAVVVFSEASDQPRTADADALSFAFTRKLPIVFVTKLSSAALAKNDEARAQIAEAQVFNRGGIPCMAVDGDDTVAIYRVAGESLRRARDGGGPTWIDCHFGLRPTAVAQNSNGNSNGWQAHSPIEQMEFFLKKKGLFSQDWAQQVRSDFQARLSQAMERTAKASSPATMGWDQGVFCLTNGDAKPIVRARAKR